MATLKERVDKHDREIAAIRKLVQTGMKMLVENERQIRETNRQLQLLIRSLHRGEGNGHKDKRIE